MSVNVQSLSTRADAHLRQGASLAVLDGLFDELRACVREDPTSLEHLAGLFEQLSRARKRVADGAPRWMPLGSGHLALGPRPKLRRVARLAHHGATHVLTLLSERERTLLGSLSVFAAPFPTDAMMSALMNPCW